MEKQMYVKPRIRLFVMVFTAELVLFTVSAWAQDKLADTMQLTEAEAKAFWPVYASYQKELSTLNDRMIKLINEYAHNYQTISDQVAKRLVDEYLTIEAARQKLRQTYLPRFRKVLREKQVARYYQLENKVQAAVNYELAAEIPLVK
jgi:hypothetical protein